MGTVSGEETLSFSFSLPFKWGQLLTLLHSERPKLYTILAFLSAIGLIGRICSYRNDFFLLRVVPILEGFHYPGKQTLSPFVKWRLFIPPPIPPPPIKLAQLLTGRICSYRNNFFPLRVVPILEGFHHPGKQKLFPFVKWRCLAPISHIGLIHSSLNP